MTKVNPNYDEFVVTLAGGATDKISRFGEVIVCLDADEAFKIRLANETWRSSETTFKKGLSFTSPKMFSEIFLSNPNAGAITITLGVATGEVQDNRVNLAGSLSANIDGGDTINSGGSLIGSLSRTLIAAADNTRLELSVSNLTTGSTLWLGDASVNVFEGVPVPAGSTATISTSAPVYGIHQFGVSVQIATLEAKK